MMFNTYTNKQLNTWRVAAWAQLMPVSVCGEIYEKHLQASPVSVESITVGQNKQEEEIPLI